MSTLATDSIYSVQNTVPPVFRNSTGAEIGKLCKAWIYFDGVALGMVAFNVSSVTKDGTGMYRINIPVGIFADANYAIMGCNSASGTYNPHRKGIGFAAQSATQLPCNSGYVTENATAYEDHPMHVQMWS